LFGIDASFLLLEGPFLWIYVNLATGRIKTLSPLLLLHTLPYLFFTSYFLFFVHSYQGSDLYNYIATTLGDESNLTILFFGLLNHFHLIAYLVLSIYVLHLYSKKIADEFSYTEEVNLKWLWAVVMGLSVISLFIIIGLLINDFFGFVSHDFKATMIYSAFALLPFYFAFIAIRQKILYSPELPAPKKYEDSTLDTHQSKNYSVQLIALMERDKPFMDGRLTINDLAAKMNVPPKHLSQVINENFNQNFFTYINYHRVEEAKLRIRDNKYNHLKLISIGIDCGFNTKSSFNSTFKKFTGLTPSKFKESKS
jgi:AraC-like DNA-binding protein